MGEILTKLNQYSKSDIYPFHMPGHKRNFSDSPLQDLYRLDITEIDGFDDLHEPEGLILDSMRKASALYQADETFFLVNGSTAGNLAAISATVSEKQKILMGRNSHKSAYHAVYLRNADPVYLYPDYSKQFQFWGSVTPKEVETNLLQNPECKAVFLTSPTYEGIVSDVEKIAEITHRYQIPLIVDEAHGAHFGLDPRFPKSAIQLGADLVIQSLHKTMPSPTQTALLHIKGNLVDRDRLKKFLKIYQSSSPSYLFVAGIDEAIHYVERNRNKLFTALSDHLYEFYQRAKELKSFEILSNGDQTSFFNYDRSRIVIGVRSHQITGKELLQVLLEKYHLQLEMAGMYHVTAISGIMDTKEGFDRLIDALIDLDQTLSNQDKMIRFYEVPESEHFLDKQESIMSPGDADSYLFEKVKLDEAEGRIAADYIYLYPPGSPIIVPGEVIKGKLILLLKQYCNMGLVVRGVSEGEDKEIHVLQKKISECKK